MDVNQVTAQTAGSFTPVGGNAASLPSYQAAQPFEAYLLSLSDAATAFAQAPLGPAAETDAGAAASDTEPGAQDAADAARAAETRQSDQLADDVRTAANAAKVAASAATNALYASDAASAVDEGSADAAVDATAKFMGAGAMGLPDRALYAYQAIQNAVPAVSGILAASAMTANTSSNPQNRMFGQNGTAQPVSVNSVEAFALDILS